MLKLIDLLIAAVDPNGYVDMSAIKDARAALDEHELSSDRWCEPTVEQIAAAEAKIAEQPTPPYDEGEALVSEAYAADDAVLGPQEAATVQIPDAETGEPLNVVLSPDAASGDDPDDV